MTGCISCIKDATTGVCRDIKDKTAREQLEYIQTTLNEIQELVNSITGIDGGSLATDEDIKNLQSQVDKKLNRLTPSASDEFTRVYGQDPTGKDVIVALSEDARSKTLAMRGTGGTLVVGTPTSSSHAPNKLYVDNAISTLQTSIDNINTIIDGLTGNVDGLVTTDEFNTLKKEVLTLKNNLNLVGSTLTSQDISINTLESQITNITTSVNNIIDTINNLDNSYAKDSDITDLDNRITTLENTPVGISLKSQTFTDIQSLFNFLNTADRNKIHCVKVSLASAMETSGTQWNITTTGVTVNGSYKESVPAGDYYLYPDIPKVTPYISFSNREYRVTFAYGTYTPPIFRKFSNYYTFTNSLSISEGTFNMSDPINVTVYYFE